VARQLVTQLAGPGRHPLPSGHQPRARCLHWRQPRPFAVRG
jgi:hypothetical protein